MKRYIRNAEEDKAPDKEELLDDALGVLKDDFNFAIDGIAKISADGNVNQALDLASALSDAINAVIDEIAQGIAKGE